MLYDVTRFENNNYRKYSTPIKCYQKEKVKARENEVLPQGRRNAPGY
jgi:hypothetical protein